MPLRHPALPPLLAPAPRRPLARWPLFLLTATAALIPATGVGAHGDTGSILWWQFDPLIWLSIILTGAAYIYATGVIEQRDPEAVTTRQTWYFLGGLIVAFIALQSPIDAFADDAFWVHMIQHIMLISVVPPLLLIGTPAALVRPALRIPGVLPVMRVLTNAGFAWLFSTAVFLGWHIPALYNAAVLSNPVHALEHLLFIGTALLFWWPVFSPVPDELPRLTRANQVGYLALACQPNVILGAVLVFGPTAYYAVYAGANRLMPNLSPLVDQQIGGSIMWVPGNILYLVIISRLFFDWFTERERVSNEEAAADWQVEQEQTAARAAAITTTPPDAMPTRDGAESPAPTRA